MVGTASYDLAKYLDKWIKPCIPDTYMLDSTVTFLSKLKSFIFGSNDVLVSFDVESLFTNVPLKETINLITDYLYDKNNGNKPPFTKLVFKNMLKLATGGFFMYNGKLYTQVDGVTMGSPLGPTLANFFLAHLESKLFHKNEQTYPKLYLRYVDDVFSVFSSDVDFMHFFHVLNNMHKNIRFTYEVGNSNLAFLDTEVSIVNAEFESWVYRKKTNTNVILNAFAMCPNEWKKGLVYCFLNRAWIICSSQTRFQEEVETLKQIFTKNGYSINFFQKKLKEFLTKKQSNSPLNESVPDDENKRYILLIPFIGKPSLIFKRKICEIFKQAYDVELSCVFGSFKVKNYFSLKCQSSPYLISNVTYKYTCQRDADAFYIGETCRHIGMRAEEHLDCLSKTRKPTAVGDHILNCDGCKGALKSKKLSYKNFEILNKCRTKFDCEVKEAFLVKKLKPKLNGQLFQNGASRTLLIFT